MDTVCENKENKEHSLEGRKGSVGCDYDGRGWAGCEDGGDKVGEEGRHGGCEKMQFRSGGSGSR